jgi:CheY-like chemotaxis protein
MSEASSNAKCRLRILIVDDEADHRYLLKTLLSEVWSLEVSFAEASDGREALEQTRQWRPHLIFMDLLMPQMNGYEAIRRIRELGQDTFADVNKANRGSKIHSPDVDYSQIWIVALTADVLADSRSRAYSAGCHAFVTKPYSADQLYAAVQPILSGSWDRP